MLIILATYQAQSQPIFNIDLNNKGISIRANLYGIFFEDINHATDGGLNAELIPQYRSIPKMECSEKNYIT